MVQPRDAREASDVFYRQRIGDVLLTYENEVVLTNQVGGWAGGRARGGLRGERVHAQQRTGMAAPACGTPKPRQHP